MKVKELRKLSSQTRAYCCKCGCQLEDMSGEGIGSIFVLDNNGNFYCMDCDKIFEDVDARIFDVNLYDGKDNEDEIGYD